MTKNTFCNYHTLTVGDELRSVIWFIDLFTERSIKKEYVNIDGIK